MWESINVHVSEQRHKLKAQHRRDRRVGEVLRSTLPARGTRVQNCTGANLAVLQNSAAPCTAAAATGGQKQMQVLQLANPAPHPFPPNLVLTPLDLPEMFTRLPRPQDLACSIAVYEFAWQPDINIQPTSK